MWYLLNPPTGLGTFNGTFGATTTVKEGVSIALTGVNQTTPINGSVSSAPAAATSGSITLSIGANNWFVGGVSLGAVPGTTDIGTERGTANNPTSEVIGNTSTGGTLRWTGASQKRAMVGAEVVSAANPLAATIIDYFDNGSTINAQWAKVGGQQTRITQGTGQLVITSGTDATYNDLVSTTVDLQASSMYVNYAGIPNQSLGNVEMIMYYGNPVATNKIWWTLGGNNIGAYKLVSGVQTQIGTNIPYNATNHAWFRIREAAGTTFWDTSVNGRSFTTQFQAANPIGVTGGSVAIQVGAFGTQATTTAGTFDNFNVVPGAGTNLIQSTGTAVLGIGSTSVTWPSNTTTGNLIVVGVALTNAAVLGTVSSITDNQSNTYTKAVSGTQSSLGDVLGVELWYAKNITGGAGSVTVNHTVDNTAMFAREYSGFNTLDVTNSALGSSTTPNSGTSAATAVNSELVIVATGDDKGATQLWYAMGSYGDMVGTATTITGISMEDQIITATGAQTGTLNLASAANWDSLLATFQNVVSNKAGYRNLLGVGI